MLHSSTKLSTGNQVLHPVTSWSILKESTSITMPEINLSIFNCSIHWYLVGSKRDLSWWADGLTKRNHLHIGHVAYDIQWYGKLSVAHLTAQCNQWRSLMRASYAAPGNSSINPSSTIKGFKLQLPKHNINHRKPLKTRLRHPYGLF